MRLPSFPIVIRAFQALVNSTARSVSQAQLTLQKNHRPHPATKQHMPSIPSLLGSLFSSTSTPSAATQTSDRMSPSSYPVQKSESEWQAQLSPEQFRVLRKQGTEPPFTGKYDKHAPTRGTYTCVGCDAPLYTAQQKFKSGCGWPAFYDTVPGAVTRHVDRAFGMERIEIVCSNCGGHLGHVFKGEGYATPTDERHCVNSISINFRDEDPVKEKESKA